MGIKPHHIIEQTKAIKTSDFNYCLPKGKIAKYPLGERSNSKLLIWDKGNISETIFNQAPSILPGKSMLVFNNTKVVRARLIFKKETGAKIEVFCLEPHEPCSYELSFNETQAVSWKCIVGNSKKWKSGELQLTVSINNNPIVLKAEREKDEGGAQVIKFRWGGGYTFSEVIENAGIIPIPPYLNRESEESDNTSYQTVFAKIKGSVAAPTAGLHFTGPLLKKIRGKGVATSELTLHVGAGTFKPVKSETIAGHTMHNEVVTISFDFLKKLYNHQYKVIAVGTTSVRSLESIYWLGLKITEEKQTNGLFHISQWEPYAKQHHISAKEAISRLISFMGQHQLSEVNFSTQIIIAPGYDFKIIDGMFTNFHQPQSTLLLLISAFLGNDWKKVYKYALQNNFRFLSYGDSNLYLK